MELDIHSTERYSFRYPASPEAGLLISSNAKRKSIETGFSVIFSP
jgi:hypothetical protein